MKIKTELRLVSDKATGKTLLFKSVILPALEEAGYKVTPVKNHGIEDHCWTVEGDYNG